MDIGSTQMIISRIKIMRKTYKIQSFNDRVKIIKDIALNYGKTKGPTDMAKEYGISKQRIQQIAAELRRKGFDIPRIQWKRKSAMSEAIKQLKNK